MLKSKNKKITIDDLAIMVAKGFGGIDKKFGGIDKKFESVSKDIDGLRNDITEVKESVKFARRDILNIGDRFVPRFEFDNLLTRVGKIEQKIKSKVG